MLDGENGQGQALEPNAGTLPADAVPPEGAQQQQTEAPTALQAPDPDEAEMQAALAAVQAEQGGTQQQEPAAGGQQQTEGQQQPPQGASGQQPPAPIMVPLGRLQQEAAARKRAQAEADYLRGALEAERAARQGGTGGQQGQQGQAPAQPGQAQQQDPYASEIEAAQAEIDRAAEQFDSGAITLAEFKKVELPHMRRIAALEAEQAAARVAPRAQSLADEEIQAVQVNALAARHPYVNALTQDMAAQLARIAAVEAEAEGRPYGSGPREDMRLREHVARLSDTWGPKWGLQARQPTQQQQQQTQPAPNGAPSPQASARMAKMEAAAGHPPDTSGFGQGGQGDAISDARIMTMSDEEISALPATVRARILGTG